MQKQQKRNTTKKQLVKYKYDTKSVWKTLNQIMSKHEKKFSLPKEITVNSCQGKISNWQVIANKFNEFSVNVGPAIAKKVPKSDRICNEYLAGSYKNSF